MFIFEEPSTIIPTAILLSVIFFGIQLFLCGKARKTSVKLLPLYTVLLLGGFSLLIASGILGAGSGFLGNVQLIVAGILAVLVAAAALGMAIAWTIYRCRLKQKK